MAGNEIIKTEKVLVRIMELEENGATDWHYHTEVTDFFVCLTGAVALETWSPAGTITLSPGQRAEVVAKTVHRVVNLSAGKAEYLLVQGVGTYDFCKDFQPEKNI